MVIRGVEQYHVWFVDKSTPETLERVASFTRLGDATLYADALRQRPLTKLAGYTKGSELPSWAEAYKE